MHAEAFHRLIKVVYFQGKQNRRIDHLLYTLLKISRDKAFDRLTKLEKGKPTHQLCDINKRHKSWKMTVYKSNVLEHGQCHQLQPQVCHTQLPW